MDEAIDDLRAAAALEGLDPLTFTLGEPTIATEGHHAGAEITVTAYLGVTVFGRFPIDLITGLTPVAELDHQIPRPAVTIDDVAPPTPFTLWPIPDQIADKICAMYERHGRDRQASSRYRDLVDLVLITNTCPIPATDTRTALANEASRRNLTLPQRLTRPAPDWTSGYAEIARQSRLPPQQQNLQTALDTVNICLGRLLADEITTGTWDPETRTWIP